MSETPASDPQTEAPLDAERRAALEKLGRLAALTPPVIMTLMLSPRASADSYSGPDVPPDDP